MKVSLVVYKCGHNAGPILLLSALSLSTLLLSAFLESNVRLSWEPDDPSTDVRGRGRAAAVARTPKDLPLSLPIEKKKTIVCKDVSTHHTLQVFKKPCGDGDFSKKHYSHENIFRDAMVSQFLKMPVPCLSMTLMSMRHRPEQACSK